MKSFIAIVRAAAQRAHVTEEQLEVWQGRWVVAYAKFNLPPISTQLPTNSKTALHNLNKNVGTLGKRLDDVQTELKAGLATLASTVQAGFGQQLLLLGGAGGGNHHPQPQPQPQPLPMGPPTKRQRRCTNEITISVGGGEAGAIQSFKFRTAGVDLKVLWSRWYTEGWYLGAGEVASADDHKKLTQYGQLIAMANAIHAAGRKERGEPAVELTAYPPQPGADRLNWVKRMDEVVLALEADVVDFVSDGHTTKTGKRRSPKAEGLISSLAKIAVSKWQLDDVVLGGVVDKSEGKYKFSSAGLRTFLGKRKEAQEA
jgi:hypothetical protein